MRASLSIVVLVLATVASACASQSSSSGDDDTECSAIDDKTLANLRISIAPNLAMKPGESSDLQLGNVECCYIFKAVDTCTRWSVGPSDLASIDPDTGLLHIADAAQPGDVVTVTADVENGRKQVTIEVYVYTPESNPLFGLWREDAEFACEDGAEVAPAHAINELQFRADGTINVTWEPFELYVDYWGTYAYDLAVGSLSIEPTGGNYVPADIDGAGTFSLDAEGHLTLDDIWLGSQPQGSPARCGHRFRR
jgi:hypothetical protein